MAILQSKKEETTTKAEGLGCFVRLLWMGAGNIALLYFFLMLARRPAGEAFLSWVDGAFWGTVAALIVIRYIDITKLGGLTASNDKATTGTWWRYSLLLGIVAGAVWGAGHLLSHYAIL
jgi:hypothetical protein